MYLQSRILFRNNIFNLSHTQLIIIHLLIYNIMTPDIIISDNDCQRIIDLLTQFQSKKESILIDFLNRKKIQQNNQKNYKIKKKASIVFDHKVNLQKLNELIRIKPNDPILYKQRGNLYYKYNQFELALMDYNLAIQYNPQYPEAYFKRGCIYQRKNQFQKAIIQYTIAIQYNPHYSDAFNNRGYLYRVLNQPSKANSDFTDSIRQGTNHKAYYNKGLLYYEQFKNIQKAISNFNKAIQINHRIPQYYIVRGLMHQKLNQIENAISDYNKSIIYSLEYLIKSNPKFIPQKYLRGYIYRGKLCKQFGLLNYALHDFNIVLYYNSSIWSIYAERGEIYFMLNNYQNSQADLLKAVSYPNHSYSSSFYYLGRIYFFKNLFSKAQEYFSQAIRIYPRHEYYLYRGIVKSIQQDECSEADYLRAFSGTVCSKSFQNLKLIYRLTLEEWQQNE